MCTVIPWNDEKGEVTKEGLEKELGSGKSVESFDIFEKGLLIRIQRGEGILIREEISPITVIRVRYFDASPTLG